MNKTQRVEENRKKKQPTSVLKKLVSPATLAGRMFGSKPGIGESQDLQCKETGHSCNSRKSHYLFI